jgi:hypothetical protein
MQEHSPYSRNLENQAITTAAPPGISTSSVPLSPLHPFSQHLTDVDLDELWAELGSINAGMGAPLTGVELLPLERESVPGLAAKAAGSRMRLSRDARIILDRWFEENRNDPYVEKREAQQLAAVTGLTVRQVRTYFANSRARKLPASRVDSSSPEFVRSTGHSSDSTGPERHPSKRRRRLTLQPPTTSSSDQQSPMERFLSSSPEDEGIDEGIVRDAAARVNSNFNERPTLTPKKPKSVKTNLTIDTTGKSSTSNSSSSCPSIDTARHRGPRRGRRRQPFAGLPHLKTVMRAVRDPKKMFQCTFCSKDFIHKYDWRRHEESVHFPQEEWVCMPDDRATVSSPNGTRYCPFCSLENPDADHSESHNCAACLESPRHQRVFTRKDKLLQHIGQVHKPSTLSSYISGWRRPVQRKVMFRCGICGVDIASWPERMDHISGHFTAGQDMRFWRGEPGQIHAADEAATATSDRRDSALLPPTMTTTKVTIDDKPHACTARNCAERFSKSTDLIYHERRVHNIYEELNSAVTPAVSAGPWMNATPTSAAPPPQPLPPPPPPSSSSSFAHRALGNLTSSQSMPGDVGLGYRSSPLPGVARGVGAMEGSAYAAAGNSSLGRSAGSRDSTTKGISMATWDQYTAMGHSRGHR